MASRDLTQKFVDRRYQRKDGRATRKTGPRGDFAQLRSGSFASDISDVELGERDRPTLPPIWVDLVEAVDADVEKIGKATRELQTLHKKRLMVTFDDSNESALDDEIEMKIREATKLFRACEQTLKRIALSNDDCSDSERTIRANIQRSSAQKIQKLNQEFRRSQQEFLARLKKQKEGANDATFDFLSGSGGGGGNEKADDAGFNEQQLQAVADLEALVSERDEEIRKIAESIQELGTIFKELAVLVIDQGTILDRIDFNMEQVAEHTRKGVVEIEKAEQYQKQARPRICIILLLVLNSLMIVFLVLKHNNSGNGKKK